MDYSSLAIVLALCIGGAAGYALGRQSLRALSEALAFERSRTAAFADTLRLELDNAAQKALGTAQDKLSQNAGGRVAEAVTPLRDKLVEFRTALDARFGEQQKEVATLRGEIAAMIAAQTHLRDSAAGLTAALRGNNKAQGQWGEIQLERLLEAAGLQAGRDFHRQGAGLDLVNDDGKRQLPDIIVALPENRHVVVDAKVSLLAFERLANAAAESDRAAQEKLFLQSIDAHIKDLSAKNYPSLSGLNSPEIVLMFMPLESAFSLALSLKPELLHEAWARRVLLVSPTTLFAALRTISSLWQIERQNKNAAEICRVAGQLHDKIAAMADHIDKVAAALQKAEASVDEARAVLTTGRGSAARQLETLRNLGAASKKEFSPAWDAHESDLTIAKDAA